MTKKISGHNSAHGESVHTGHEGFKSANIFPKYEQIILIVPGAGGPVEIDSSFPLAADTIVTGLTVEVTEVFDGAATLEIGDIVTPDLLAAIGEFDLTTLGASSKETELSWPLESVIRAILGGASTTGSLQITAAYSEA